MGSDAMKLLTRQIARRNHMYLFTWVAALGLPWAMQYLAGTNDDVMSYMTGYYGYLSLFMFFGLTYGFAAVFVSFYIMSSLRRAGSLDMLRVSGMAPREAVLGFFWQLQWVLVPPALGFMVVFGVYARLTAGAENMLTFGWLAIIGGAFSLLLAQAALVAIMAMKMFRREYGWTLLLLVLVLPVNFAPIIMVYALGLPMPLFILLYVGLIWASLNLATRAVGRLWPASVNPANHT